MIIGPISGIAPIALSGPAQVGNATGAASGCRQAREPRAAAAVFSAVLTANPESSFSRSALLQAGQLTFGS